MTEYVYLEFGPFIDALGQRTYRTVDIATNGTIKTDDGFIIQPVKLPGVNIVSVKLVASNSSGVNPTGFTYAIAVDGIEKVVTLPKSVAHVNWADLAPADGNEAVYTPRQFEGPTGPRGPKGERGEPGVKGDKGDKGDPGAVVGALGGLSDVDLTSLADGDLLEWVAGSSAWRRTPPRVIVAAGRPDVPSTVSEPHKTRAASAPVGTKFQSTDRPQGAYEWLKVDASTWVCTVGDTGQRQLKRTNDWGGGLYIRRINSTVWLALEALNPRDSTSNIFATIPEGFRPTGAPGNTRLSTFTTAPKLSRILITGSTAAMLNYTPDDVFYSVSPYAVSLMSAWPATLPGSAV